MSATQPIPTSIRQATMASVVSILNVAPRHYTLTLKAPALASTAKAGQFVHVLARNTSDKDPFLRRAFSVMAVEGDCIQILFRVEGRGTAWLSEVHEGEVVDLLGPLGKPFDLAPFKTEPTLKPILVGGGVGVPPMVFLAETFQKKGIAPLVIVGARSRQDVLGLETFESRGVECRVATEDGSLGRAGRVTTLLDEALEADNKAVVYACGPWPMLRAVATVAKQHGVACQVSMEENMPCGIGVCNGCVVAMNETAGDYERYRRICIEGPAVWASEVDWGQS